MCPHCGGDGSKVLETRRHHHQIYRRRECLECEKRFISREEAPLGLDFPASMRDASIRRLRNRKSKGIHEFPSTDVFNVRFDPQKDEE